ncbi:MAG TPA: hypothetical protein VK993_01745 [Chthoniobacterales bacterium]|nr:hypothetical protein [Chthoniobacterales bacterium]
MALVLTNCARSYAPIYGSFEGFGELIAKADVIVVARIVEKTTEEDLGGAANYRVWCERILKGTPEAERVTVNIRNLDLYTAAAAASAVPLDDLMSFRIDARYVLLLVRTDEHEGATYTNVNCEGSSFEVSGGRSWNSSRAGRCACCCSSTAISDALSSSTSKTARRVCWTA